MKKLFLTLAVILASITASKAQDVFVKDDIVVHFGLGLGSYLGGSGYKTTVPPILASGEYCITDALINDGKGFIGVGGYLAYAANKYSYYPNHGFTHAIAYSGYKY